MAEARLFFGNSGCAARSALSSAPNTVPHTPTCLSVVGQRLIRRGGTTNSSSIVTPSGFAARGFRSIMTISGTSVSRAQNEQRHRLNGNQRGACMISTGITGTASQGTMP